MQIILIKYFFKILGMLVKYELDQVIMPRFLAISKLRKQKYQDKPVPHRVKLLLEGLGPLWVKFGQILSTRYDVFPQEWIKALASLQDAVEPFDNKMAEKVLKSKIPNFDEDFIFDATVLASASIAQVYAAKLKTDGSEVVIKVLRPKVTKQITRDIKCLKLLAKLFSRFLHDSKRLHLQEVVEELEHSLRQEVNFYSEAANAATFARHFSDEPGIKIPKIYWNYSSESVLVLERFYGTPIYEIDELISQGEDMPALARRGVELFFTQVLRDSFFHADMHPGNIFINKGKFLLVDFGIVGSLNAMDQRYIAENMLAFFKRDYRRVAVLHVESGWVPKDTRIEHFEAAIRQVCEPIFARPLKDISFAQLFLQLLRTAREFKTEIQPQLILLQKTLLQIESLGRMIDPELDLWEVVQPQLEQWVKSQMGWQGFKNKSKEQVPYWLEHAPDIPELLMKYLRREPELKAVNISTSPVWPFFSGAVSMALIVMVILYVK